MPSEKRQKISEYLDTALLFTWGIFFLLFPLFFLTITTDAVVIPKAILLGATILISLLIWGIRMLIDGQVKLTKTPFDLPVLLFGIAMLLSSVFSVDKANSFISVVPILYVVMSYFVITNLPKRPNTLSFLITSLLSGGALSSLIAVANHYKLYLLPFQATHVVTFTTFGNYLDQALYAASLLIIAGVLSIPLFKKQKTTQGAIFAGLGGVILLGLLASTYLLFTSQKPNLLPFEVGFQTAFAAISQDTGRVAQGFFFGSGYGNYGDVFSRFKPASFNTNPSWYLPFNTSSSLVLELLATTGIIGLLSYIFLIIKVIIYKGSKIHNSAYFAFLLLVAVSFVLPFSFITLSLVFFVLAIFSLIQSQKDHNNFFDVEFQFVALRKGIFSFVSTNEERRRKNNLTPLFALLVFLGIIATLGFYSTTYVYSDILFQKSLIAANNNSGTLTYNLELQAINTFSNRSAYYRIFSQTNIQLASSLLQLTSNGSSPSAQAQSTGYALIQQAISAGKQATILSPNSVIEWQNLSSIYQALIGVGQNADSFALSTTQQALQLDPTNPQEYLTLGGLYYRLGQYDNAIAQFQSAANLKQDYPNAYYNLAHAYEQKNDLQNALASLQIVKQLVATDKQNSEKIDKEISDLQAKIGSQTPTSPQVNVNPSQTQQQLSLPKPQNALPQQKEEVPLTTPTASPTPSNQ